MLLGVCWRAATPPELITLRDTVARRRRMQRLRHGVPRMPAAGCPRGAPSSEAERRRVDIVHSITYALSSAAGASRTAPFPWVVCRDV